MLKSHLCSHAPSTSFQAVATPYLALDGHDSPCFILLRIRSIYMLHASIIVLTISVTDFDGGASNGHVWIETDIVCLLFFFVLSLLHLLLIRTKFKPRKMFLRSLTFDSPCFMVPSLAFALSRNLEPQWIHPPGGITTTTQDNGYRAISC